MGFCCCCGIRISTNSIPISVPFDLVSTKCCQLSLDQCNRNGEFAWTRNSVPAGRFALDDSISRPPGSCGRRFVKRPLLPGVLKSHWPCDSVIVNGTWRWSSFASPRCSNSAVTTYRLWTPQSSTKKYFSSRRTKIALGPCFSSGTS